MDTCRREQDNDTPREGPWWRNERGTREGGGRMPEARGEAVRVNETKLAMRDGLGLSASPCSLVLLVLGRGTPCPGNRSAPLSKLPTAHAPCPSPHRERKRADVEAIASPKKKNYKCIRLDCSNKETIFVERSAVKLDAPIKMLSGRCKTIITLEELASRRCKKTIPRMFR